MSPLKQLLSLRLSAAERAVQKKAVIFSLKTIRYVLAASPDCVVHQMYSTRELPNDISRVAFPTSIVSSDFILRASGLQTVDGDDACAAVIEIPESPPLESFFNAERLIILDNVRDPGNLGTILRTCASFGWRALLSTGCVCPYNDKVLRSGVGASFTAVWKSGVGIAQLVSGLGVGSGRSLNCLALSSSERDIKSVAASEYSRVRLVVGSEACGLDEAWSRVESTPAKHVVSVRVGPGGFKGVLNVGVASACAMLVLQ